MLLTLVVAPAALALPPNNDSFASPFNVDAASGLAVTCCGANTTFEATTEPGEPLTPTGSGVCIIGVSERQMVHTTWYRVVGNGGTMSVDTFGSNFDTVIAVYDAPTPVLGSQPCSDDESGTQQSALSFATVAGKAYLIQVGGCSACGPTSSGEFGSLVMHVSQTAPPAPPPPAPPPPVVIPPPDSDGDGIPDSKDKCPTVKPTRDANNDGCQDKPIRILSDLKYDGRFIRSGGTIRGITLSRVRLTRVPAGATVRVTCSKCRRGGRAFRNFSFKARKTGTQAMGRISRLQLLRGKQLVVVVTSPDHLGRRVVVRFVGRRDRVKLSCLAVGSTSRSVPCSTGS